MKKLLFIFCSLFIICFLFSTEVYAADATDDSEYYFNIMANDSSNDFLKNILCYSPTTTCRQINAKGQDITAAGYVSNDPDDYEVKKFYIDFPNASKTMDALKLFLQSASCGAKNCADYVRETYCTASSNNASTKVCKGLPEALSSPSKSSYSGYTQCTFTPQTLAEGSKTSVTASINVLVPENQNVEQKVYIMDGMNKTDKFKVGGNTFYMHAYKQSASDFSKEYIKRFQETNSCDNIIIFCNGSNVKTNWYAIVGDSCPDGYGDYQQTVGDTTNSGIEFKNLVESEPNFVSKLIGSGTDILTCDALLSGDGDSQSISEILRIIINIIKFLVPVILIVMGSLDFIQAIFAQDEGAMKKAQAKFIKRVIIAVIIFLIPSALKLILSIAHSIWPSISADFCGIL